MTESVSKRVLDKLDEISEDLNQVKNQISAIKMQIEMQPKIDDQKHLTFDSKLNEHSEKIKGLQANQRWVILAVLGVVIEALARMVIK